ncbi:Teneurin-2, partial [Streptomyces sp. NPDC086787]
ARFYCPQAVAVDAHGNVFIADTLNHRIRRVDPSGIITTYAGTGYSTVSGDGGPAVEAGLYSPQGVVDAHGSLYIADTDNRHIRRVDASGIITTVANTGSAGFAGDNVPAL